MTMHLTPEILVSAYDFLRTTPPFHTLKLPAADDVEFRVITAKLWYGDHGVENGKNVIRLSASSIGHTSTLIRIMAHEMVHLWQAQRGHRDTHGRTFQSLALRVCDAHGFDPKAF